MSAYLPAIDPGGGTFWRLEPNELLEVRLARVGTRPGEPAVWEPA